MTPSKKSTRIHERKKMSIPLLANYREADGNEWQEKTLTEEVTICGGGFILSRPVEPKRLIKLSLQMPNNYRLYGYKNVKYDVWGIIRYIKLIENELPNRVAFRVGTALIGENPPKSFLTNPSTRYDLKPVLRDRSFWDCRELPRNTGPYVRSVDERLNIVTKLFFQTISETGKVIKTIEAETQNISESGMSLITNLTSDCTKYVLVNLPENNLILLAKVRGIHVLGDNSMRVHLEFISGKWAA